MPQTFTRLFEDHTTLDAVLHAMVLSGASKRHGDVLVWIDAAKFDSLFAKNAGFYVGPGGEGGIGERYGRFSRFMSGGEAVIAPEVSLYKSGNEWIAQFSNGRHRWAVLRDMGAKVIPVALMANSVEPARQLGLIVNS